MTLLFVGDDDATELEKLLVGRKIVSAERIPEFGWEVGRLILDDGTELELEGNEGCGGCAAGWFSLTNLNQVDNVITRVWIDTDEETIYKVFVFADNEAINLATFTGDDGNGYYGTGFSVSVRKP